MKLHTSLLAVTISMLVCTSAFSNEHVKTRSQKLQTRNWATVRGWMTTPWDGNDKPYQQMRATIDNAIASGRRPQDLVGLYELPALEHPTDPKAHFKWAYAAYVSAKQTDYNHGENILSKPRETLILAPFPRSREYARLIFLTIGYMNMPFGSQLQGVSKRMILSFPSDTDVRYAAASNLIYSTSLADRELGISYIKSLIKAEPQRASPHALLGSVYYGRWQVNKRQEDASEAVADYQQYLVLTSMSDPFRQRVEEIIAEIRKG